MDSFFKWYPTLVRALLLIAALTTFGSSSKATSFTAWGSHGDFHETYRCPQGQVLVGFYGRTGLWVDQLGLVCARFVRPSYAAGAQSRLPARGGSGGGPQEQACESDSAIRDVTIGVAENAYVGAIKFSCFRPRDGSFAGGKIFGGSESHDAPNESCEGSEYATGLDLYYGKHVNGAGLICDAFESAPPATEVVMLPTRKLQSSPAGDPGNTGYASNAGAIEAGPHYPRLGKRHPQCKPNYFSRLAGPNDNVCVEMQSRAQVALENNAATSRTDPNGAYGRNTCISGYVWREAFDGDLVCVTPERRDAVKEENTLASARWQ